MSLAGAIEVLMPTIQSSEIWKESGRYDDYGKEMLRIEDRNKENFYMDLQMKNLLLKFLEQMLKAIKNYP